MSIKSETRELNVPRFVVIFIKKLNISFQPNRGSSFYKKPPRKKIKKGQKDWNSPIGTLRISDHWNYKDWGEHPIYQTDVPVSEYSWVLAINTGQTSCPWKVIYGIKKCGKGDNIIARINFKELKVQIAQEIEKAFMRSYFLGMRFVEQRSPV